ncbi:hypothetical protein BKA83DRAFT_4338332 [Pisolithus microcarpus]|nr:hypothetical protein BKA83DRAFT_4338332 [Pisolithus microcarpus]
MPRLNGLVGRLLESCGWPSKGVLQREGCPIFECNQFCGCDEDCPNRVVQNGRMWPVNIVKTERKGWGM